MKFFKVKRNSKEILMARNLKKALAHKGFSLRELGRRTGLSASFLSDVANGKRSVSIMSAKKIEKVLGTA